MASRMQTRVYRSLLIQAGKYLNGGEPFLPEQVEMIYWFSEFPDSPAHFPYNTTQYKHDWESLTSLTTEISNHRHFPLTEDTKKCAFCTYRSYCSRGEKAGFADDLDGEEKQPEFDLEQIIEIEF